MSGIEEIKKTLMAKASQDGDFFIYLPSLNEFQKQEIEFHNQIINNEAEAHQLNSLRNSYYHAYFKKWLDQLPNQAIILEIGVGNGNDLLELAQISKQAGKNFNLIASDISLESLKLTAKKFTSALPINQQPLYLVADGQNLPFADNSLDAIFMVACLHHFENQAAAIKEFARVLKPCGQLIFAMEPSKWMMFFTKLFANFKRLRIHCGASAADESHPGYFKKDFMGLIKADFAVIKIKRVWLLQGFIHYALEACFRIFKLNQRLKLPRVIEYLLLVLDEILLKLPIINWLNWHWILVLKKKNS